MRAELISLRSRAEGKQSSERLTTSSLWRNTSTLESLISFSRWGSEWIFSVCFLKTWLSLSVFPGEQSTAERSQCLSRPLVVIGRAVIYHERRREVTGQRPQSPGGLFNHREWALIPPLNTKFELLPEFHAPCSYTINSLQFAAGCQIQSVNCMLSLRNAVVEQVKHKLKLPLEHTEADDVYNYYQVWFLTLKSEF